MTRLPSLFVSHGAPDFALDPGRVGPQLTALGRALDHAAARPAAVAVVSPHWTTPHATVGLSSRPPTIHDFGGFGAALYDIDYPAPGHPELARRAFDALQAAGWQPRRDARRGLDHGAWVALRHLFPAAGVPVFPVSLPTGLDADTAWAFGRALAPLADQGVLIVGSGCLTHDLSGFRCRHDHEDPRALAFAAWIADAVSAGDGEALRQALTRAPHARDVHPTPEHFWPLLVAAGAAGTLAPATLLPGGIAHGVLAMDAVVFGAVSGDGDRGPDGRR